MITVPLNPAVLAPRTGPDDSKLQVIATDGTDRYAGFMLGLGRW